MSINDLVDDRRQVQVDRPAKQSVEVFERNSRRVPKAERREHIESRSARAGPTDPRAVGVEVDHLGRNLPPIAPSRPLVSLCGMTLA